MGENSLDWVVVAGAKGSLGRNAVERYLSRGWRVLALDRASEAVSWQADTANLHLQDIDLADPTAVQAALDAAIPSSDRIDLLVNAVGLIWNEPVLALRGARFRPHALDSWTRVIEANLTAPFVVAAAVAARMARKGGGAIVNFSSISASGNAGQAAYSAAKAGIEGLTRAMAAELGPIGIRVNAIAPGFIDVPSTRAALSEEQLKVLASRTPARRLGHLDELLDAVDFLANNTFATGMVLNLDGGLRL